MTHAAITGDFLQTSNALVDLTTKMTFDDEIVVQKSRKFRNLLLGHVACFDGRINADLATQLQRSLQTDAVKIR